MERDGRPVPADHRPLCQRWDVLTAVRRRDLGLEIGVRCGGHSVLGLAVPDDGLMIDLTPMGAVRVRDWPPPHALEPQ